MFACVMYVCGGSERSLSSRTQDGNPPPGQALWDWGGAFALATGWGGAPMESLGRLTPPTPSSTLVLSHDKNNNNEPMRDRHLYQSQDSLLVF